VRAAAAKAIERLTTPYKQGYVAAGRRQLERRGRQQRLFMPS